VTRAAEPELPRRAISDIGLELARMALRLGDEEMLRHGLRLHRENRVAGGPPLRVAEERWAHGLADGDHVRIGEAADEMEHLGFVYRAITAWSDAAVLAARVGVPSGAERRARERCEASGLHPILGPLPETRCPPTVVVAGDTAPAVEVLR
jgi:hypothetical protein